MSNIEVGAKVLVCHPYTDEIVEGQVIAKGITPIIGQSYYQVEIDKGSAALNLFDNEIIVCDE
jgi:hypothetical protein